MSVQADSACAALLTRLVLPLVSLLAVTAGELFAQDNTTPSQSEEHQRRASRWDHGTAERLFRKGAWREGVAYLGRALRIDPQNSAAARHLWSAVVHGEGDRNTLSELVLQQEAEIKVAIFSPDGRRVLTASADKTARLCDAATGAAVGEPMQHEDEIVAAVFSPDGARIVTASKDRTARLWDAATAKAVAEPMRHEHSLDNVAFNSTGTRIVTQSHEAGVACLWDAVTGAPVGEALPHKAGDGEPATFSSDGKLLTTIDSGNARIWDLASGKLSGKPLRLPSGAERAVFSPDRKRAVTVSGGKAQVWNTATGKLVFTLSMKDAAMIESAEFSPDGTRIITLAERSGELWDAATGKRVGGVLACAPSDAEGGTSAIFSPDSTFVLLSASEDSLVRAWNCETGEPFGSSSRNATSVLRHPAEVLEVHFTADGGRIVTTCQDHAVRVWDAESATLLGQPLRHESREGDGLRSVARSIDGTRILTVDAENTLRVWHVSAGQAPAALLPADAREAETIGDSAVASAGKKLAVSPEGTRVLTAITPETAQLSVDGQPAGEPLRHAERVTSAAFSADGATLAVVSDDGIARLWDATTAMPVSEPLRQQGGGRTAFTAEGTLISTDRESHPRVREVPPMLTGAGLSPAFVEALSGYRFSDDGVLREIPDTDLASLRAQLRAPESIDPAWRPLIAWWLAPPHLRPLSPGSELTRREYADRELAIGFYGEITNAYLIDPTHPLVHIALAHLHHGKRADFFRAYGIARLPADPAIRARAAEMLIKQEQPELARKITDAPSAK